HASHVMPYTLSLHDALPILKRFLEDRNCGFVRNPTTDNSEKPASLHVLNPRYEKIRISFKVRFRSDISSIELHIEKLKTALIRRSEEHTSELQSRENLVCRL